MDTVTLELAISPVAALPSPAHPSWQDWLSPAELAYCCGLRYAGEHLVARVIGKQRKQAVSARFYLGSRKAGFASMAEPVAAELREAV